MNDFDQAPAIGLSPEGEIINRPLMKAMAKWLVGILGFAFILVGVVLLRMADPFYIGAPTDDSLIERHQKNKLAFLTLHQMMLDDTMNYVSPTEFSKRLSSGRKQQYVQLLASIGNPDLLSDGKMTKYRYAGRGLLAIGPGWQKGIQFNCERGVQSLASLDDPNALKADDINQRTIDGNWCLIFEKFD